MYLIKQFEGSTKERLEYLSHIPGRASCDEGGKSQRNLYPMYRDIYYEAKSLSVTDGEKKNLEWFKRMAARMGTATNYYKTHSEAEALREEFLKDHLK